MKRIIIILVITLVIVSLSSCLTKTITVSGAPGTTILTKDYNQKGVIGPSGQTKIKIKKRPYTPYLLSQGPNSDICVPFALDYNNKSHFYHLITGPIAFTIGMNLTVSSSTLPFIGGVLLISGGAIESLVWFIKLSENDPENNFKYMRTQTTNNDLIIDSNNNTSE